MSQIKYLVTALLLIFLIVCIVAIGYKLTAAPWTMEPSTTTDFIEPANTTEVVNSNGKNLFSANCQTCHALDKTLPDLLLGLLKAAAHGRIERI